MSARVVITVLVAVLWVLFGLPFTMAGVFNLVWLAVAVIGTVVVLILLWRPRRRTST